MEEKIEIWQVGNTGLRNPNRIQEGFKAFANSPYVGNLRKENEIDFMNFLNTQGIIQNEDGKDTSGSHARKWRLMFSKNGFIYPQVKKKDGSQEKLGKVDDITPFGRNFLKADTYPAVQECYLRAQSVEQFAMPDGKSYFSPLRWILAIMLELERRTGSSEITRIEFALWGHTTNPSYSVEEVVNNILDLRARRKQAPSKRKFDKKEIEENAFSELYTRAQSLINAISVCGVRGKILKSNELVELLYMAYNRDEAETFGLDKAVKAGYDEMYSTAPNVLNKKMKEIDKMIEEKAMDLANTKVEQAKTELEKQIEERENNMDDLISQMAKIIIEENEPYIGKELKDKAIEKVDEDSTNEGGKADGKKKTTRGRKKSTV